MYHLQTSRSFLAMDRAHCSLGPSTHQELATRAANLRILTISRGQLSLLLRGLGEETIGDQFEHLQKVFTFANHMCVT